MNTLLCYFTGSGNSLAVARMLGESIQDYDLVPIAGVMLKGERFLVPDGTKVGIIYPMYCGGLPNIVSKFISNSDFSKASYVFTVITIGGKSSGNPVRLTSEICAKSGHALDASWWVNMPDNYIPMKSALPKEKQDRIFAEASKKIEIIASSVESREKYHDKEKFVGRMMGLAHNSFAKGLKDFDKKFTVSGECDRCRTCVKVCPVNNIISGTDGMLSWLHHCEGCLACLQFCPRHAISCGKKTEDRERYHHPDVTAEDMINQKKLE